MPQSCVEVCSQPGQSEICFSLVRATQYNTKLMGQNGHGILDLESFKKHKLEQQESKVNEGDMLQAPEVPEEVAKKPDDHKGNLKVNFIFLTVIFQPSISLVASSTELSLKSTASLPTTVSYQQGIILLIFIFIKCFGLITHFFQNLLWKIKTPPKLTILLMNHHRQLYKPKINTMVIYTIFSTRKNSSNHIKIFFSQNNSSNHDIHYRNTK